ncbi:cysteine desulfurase family protein [Aegicerativicinus sediminis]|uniref:cysteine desulfurase family protein n=1 Tax=Aegicerativicinus sediminis TaxID=2893202 RepID=UPI001E3CFE39|nr:cysteine desulfurase family protein [Aegicerativicinus sediminis]
MHQVYLDNAATTPIHDKVLDVMMQTLKNNFGNPSSTHSYGRSSKSIIESCRKRIAGHFNASASEIIFTSGGTEADNLILTSAVKDCGVSNIISTKIEHHAVLHTLEKLEKDYKVNITYLPLDDFGSVRTQDLEIALKNTAGKTLVSLMHVNNEIGNLLDLHAIAILCKEYNALLHSDTVQSIGHFNIDVKETPIDFMVASAHKFHGPKGVGFAFLRKGSRLKPFIHGGEQERGMRAGTESIHNIVGLAEALDIAYEMLQEDKAYILDLKSYFISGLKKRFPNIQFNGCSGDLTKSTYTLVNVRLPISPDKASLLQFQLDLKGIACSRGSACQSGSAQGSHVLEELLEGEELAKPSIRFSFSRYNTKEEIDYTLQVLSEFLKN